MNKWLSLFMAGAICIGSLAGCTSAAAVSSQSSEQGRIEESATYIVQEGGQDGENVLSQGGATNTVDTDRQEILQALEEKAEKSISKSYPGENDEVDGAVVAQGQSVEITGEGISFNEDKGILQISQGGTYMFAGAFEGQIRVDTEDEDVHLMLNGFAISSNDGSAILITGADEVTLTLMTETENSIQDSSPYFEENANVDIRSNGAIFTSDDFAVNGGGSLTITTENKTGILGKKDVLILDGTLQIESPRNGIKGNDLVYIAGGQTEIQAGTDGIESEDLVYMTDGTLDVLTSYEGIEALDIIIDGGAISIQASDDGVNISGQLETSESTGQNQGMRRGESALTGHGLLIRGGTLTVSSEGDGLDSNGSIWMEGGSVLVNGPKGSGNGSLDYNLDFEMTGGELIAAGSLGMVQTPSADSTINTLSVAFDNQQAQGAVVEVVDSNGEVLVQFTAEKTFQSFIYSSADIQLNETYKVILNTETFDEVQVVGTITNIGEMASMNMRGGHGMQPSSRPEGRPEDRPEKGGGRTDGQFPENGFEPGVKPDEVSGATQSKD